MRLEGQIVVSKNAHRTQTECTITSPLPLHNCLKTTEGDECPSPPTRATVRPMLVQRITLLFFFPPVCVRVYRLAICVQGFDEFMNLVLDGAEEVNVKTGTKKALGRILLKGDNITLIQNVKAAGESA